MPDYSSKDIAGLYTHVLYLAGYHPLGDTVESSTDKTINQAEQILIGNLKAGERLDPQAAAAIFAGRELNLGGKRLENLKDLADYGVVNKIEHALTEYYGLAGDPQPVS